MGTVEKWKEFWLNRNSAGHCRDTPEFYRDCAKELRILFGNKRPARVLEIGCANGVLFEFLGFENAKYKGVDFSPQLLAEFRSKHRNVDLECCEGSSYVDKENKYDLIFSNEVVQYFDLPMLDRHFGCARSMMHKDAVLVCAAIPLKLHRSHYDSGSLSETMAPRLLNLVKSRIARIVRGDSMGRWYKFNEIVTLANKNGFSVNFYASMFYFYRIHAVLRLR